MFREPAPPLFGLWDAQLPVQGYTARAHGPYYYWSRLLKGKVVQRVLSLEQVEIVARGIENYREAKELLRRWEEETAATIEIRRKAKR